jgi:hypothetical protein
MTKINDGSMVKEDLTTGVIYKVTNNLNGKIYIGRASSYEKYGKQKPSYYSGTGRLRRHISNAYSDDDDAKNECPQFYNAIRTDGEANFSVVVLKVCSLKHLKSMKHVQQKSTNHMILK